jgi:hypothetical protein
VADLTILEDHMDQYDDYRKEAWKDVVERAMQLTGLPLPPTPGASAVVLRWMRVAAAFESNEFGITCPNRWKGESALSLGSESIGNGLFVHGSYVNHSCNPNSHFVVHCLPGGNPELFIRTTRTLEKGDHVFISYTSLYATTEQRKDALFDMYQFECRCERCEAAQDETQVAGLIDTAMTGMLCKDASCGAGLLVSPADEVESGEEVEDDEEDNEGNWICSECGTMQATDGHMKCHQRLSQAISELTVVVGMGESSSSEQLKELKLAEMEAWNYLHSFHGLRHAARIMMVGMAWLNTNGKDAVQISRAAENALGPLRRAQTLDEYALWIATLEMLCGDATTKKHCMKVFQHHFGNKVGQSFDVNKEQLAANPRPAKRRKQ